MHKNKIPRTDLEHKIEESETSSSPAPQNKR